MRPLARLRPGVAAGFLAAVEEELTSFLLRQREELAAAASEAARLVDELLGLSRAGGKRLRPLFCYWGFRAGGGEDEEALARVGAALELVHLAALVHDDLLDRSRLRRGRPTVHRRLGAEGRPGAALAVLVGDLAQAMADHLFLQAAFPPDRLLAAHARFALMRQQAVAGELLDLLAEGRGEGEVGEEEARRVARLKSASYSVVGPLLVGATLAEASPSVLEVLARYGWPLGEAFQLRDDVLGTFGDPRVTGKDRDTDVREGKRTVLVVKALAAAGPEGRAVLRAHLGREDATREVVERVRGVLRESGALSATLELIGSLSRQAKGALSGAGLRAEVVEALDHLADLVALRDA